MDDEKYRPISPIGYIGYQFLFAIPVIGFICVIIFSITAKNQNVKNFARAQIILYFLAILFVAIGSVFALISGFTLQELADSYSASQTM